VGKSHESKPVYKVVDLYNIPTTAVVTGILPRTFWTTSFGAACAIRVTCAMNVIHDVNHDAIIKWNLFSANSKKYVTSKKARVEHF
jgi:hypothetical protein